MALSKDSIRTSGAVDLEVVEHRHDPADLVDRVAASGGAGAGVTGNYYKNYAAIDYSGVGSGSWNDRADALKM
ncbi:hypothetical protein [Streptomyces sp. NPDC048611]|uniref:hypothetical protein n=1 Tax=Streptomyces sp. NPDC048611 TaxID=3155635 RepID=UPI00341A7E84